jgi:hypothetical protein
VGGVSGSNKIVRLDDLVSYRPAGAFLPAVSTAGSAIGTSMVRTVRAQRAAAPPTSTIAMRWNTTPPSRQAYGSGACDRRFARMLDLDRATVRIAGRMLCDNL